MRISATLDGVEIEVATIADPLLRRYVKKYGRPVRGSAGRRVLLTQREWHYRPGVKSDVQTPAQGRAAWRKAHTAQEDDHVDDPSG